MENGKTILAIIGLLAIGFVGGFVSHRQLTKKEMHRVVKMGEGNIMVRHIYNMVDPTEEQQEALEPILRRHAKEMAQLMRATRDQRQTLIHQLEADIKPILSKEQLDKLHEFHHRFREHRSHEMPRRKLRKRQARDSLH